MDTLPKPDIVAQDVPLDTLDGTAASVSRAAQAAGYTVTATRALGPRVPRTTVQPVVRVRLTTIRGRLGDTGWGFTAAHTPTDGWDVIRYRPGWPALPSSITELRDTFKAQAAAA